MAWQVDPAHTSVEFSVRHMAITTVRGRFERVEGTVDIQAGQLTKMAATIQAGSINTREPQRDEHLRSADFLDAGTYPTLEFRSSRIEPRGEGRYHVRGELTMRGQTHPVELTAEVTDVITDPYGNRRVGVSAEGSLRRSEWGLNWNAALEAGGLVVSDQVRLLIEVEATEVADKASV